MTQYDNSATLMWPATFEGSDSVKVPHVTALYLGDKDSITASLEDIISVAGFFSEAPGSVDVQGIEVFGEFNTSNQVIVAVLTPEDLAEKKRELTEALKAELGIEDASSYPDYRPHVTLGSVFYGIKSSPDTVELGALQLWWGDEHYDL